MTDQHPITPPLELKRKLYEMPQMMAIELAFRAGYDQRGEVNEAKLQQARDEELEACCAWLNGFNGDGEMLRIDRRPKPPSLKEQALEEVGVFEGMGTCNIDIIRRALEAIPDE